LSVDGDAGTAQAIVPTGYIYTEPCNLTVEINASVGASVIDQGSLRVGVFYVIDGRSQENQG
jgi:hypothetical protein